MKHGRFFQIPESPGDVESLRSQARPVDRLTCPRWLAAKDAQYYRCVGQCRCSSSAGADYDQLLTEISELELAGLVVDQDRSDPDLRRVYISSASDYDIWSIGIYAGRSPFELQPPPGVTNPVLTREDVTDVEAVFVADPFMVRNCGTWFMFFELLNWRANKGEIGLATSPDGVRWEYEQRVLVEPFHLSYPCVFWVEDQFFMIPETRQTRSVRLYQATAFPTGWSFVDVLLEGVNLVDATVFRQAGRWWMLVGDTSIRDHDTLRLYVAPFPIGPWKEHPASPVVEGDPHGARPAGRVIVEDARVYRLAQNCHPSYGLDVRAFEITRLNTTTYEENVVRPSPLLAAGIEPWNCSGMHHLDAHRLDNGSWLACVDGWADGARC